MIISRIITIGVTAVFVEADNGRKNTKLAVFLFCNKEKMRQFSAAEARLGIFIFSWL